MPASRHWWPNEMDRVLRLAAAVSDTEGGAAQIRELETALGAARADAGVHIWILLIHRFVWMCRHRQTALALMDGWMTEAT